MHGHWVIDVKNPDGTLAQHREFENALEASAPQLLIGLLSGYFTPGDYMIAMAASSGNGACAAAFQYCGIVRSLATYPALTYCPSDYYCGTGLTYTYNLAGPNYSMVLAGSITATQTGSIGTVYTIYNSCAKTESPTLPTSTATASPTACIIDKTGTFVGPLTATNITSVPVTAGQTIAVTVTITFS